MVISPTVVVDDFDVECVTLVEMETDSPGAVDGHGPLPTSIARELVEADAFNGFKSFNDVAASRAARSSMAASVSRPRNREPLPSSATRRLAELPQDRIITDVYYTARCTSSVGGTSAEPDQLPPVALSPLADRAIMY